LRKELFATPNESITTIYLVFTDLNEGFPIDTRGHELDWAIDLPRRSRVLCYQRKRAGMDAGDASWKRSSLVAENSRSPGYDANLKEFVYPFCQWGTSMS